MSNLPVEAAEPAPAATSSANDQTLNNEASDTAVAELPQTNGSKKVEEAKDVKEDLDTKDTDAKQVSEVKEEPEVKKDYNGNAKGKYNDRKPHFKRENRSKYDPSVLPEDKDPQKIRAQVEFYFGDANLPTDNFMWENTEGEKNLPIPIKKIHSFGRMKHFQPYVAVVDALRHSSFLLVSGEEGEETVRRKAAYDPNTSRQQSLDRSVYVKGFGEEESSSQFDIEAFFATYGVTRAVRLRRTEEDKSFKGSVFVEFEDEETAQKFLALDPKPLWKGKHELEIQSKKAYIEKKNLDIKEGRMEPNTSWSRGRGRGGGGGRGRGRRDDRRDNDRGDRDPDDWKKRREEDRASGFKEDRRGKGRDHKNGRGGRGGRGRGGRRDDRDNDRNRERDQGEKKDIKSENSKAESVKTEASPVNEKKRAREDDTARDAPSSKKVDTKPDVTVEAS